MTDMTLDPDQLESLNNALPDSTKEKLLNPTAKVVGDSLAGIIGLVLLPFQKLNILNKQNLKDFEEKVNKKTSHIPESNRDPSKLGIALKAIEEAKYQLNEEDLRELFSNLIASSVDDRKNSSITPRFATVLSQLGPKEAQLLQRLNDQIANQIALGKLIYRNNSGSRDVSKPVLILDSHDVERDIESSLDILESLGIINVTFNSWFSSDFYLPYYEEIEKYLKATVCINDTIAFEKGMISTTTFGKKLLSSIFE